MTAQGMYYLIRALVTLIAIPFHEAGHALAAWLLGDPTAKREGRISLNPFRHFDLVGTLQMLRVSLKLHKFLSYYILQQTSQVS